MRRKLVLSLFIVVVAALAVGQGKTDWPQPIIRGSIIVWGGDEAKDDARPHFKRLAGDGQILVISSTADDARATWAETSNAKVVSVFDSADLAKADSVWIDGLFVGTASARNALKAIKEKGGVVGISEELLGTGRFKALLPYVEIAGSSDSSSVGTVQMDVGDGAAIVFVGRFGRVIGSGDTKFSLAAGGGMDAVEIVVSPGGRVDLVSLRRRALDRTMPAFPVAKTPEVPSGTLMIVGGGGIPDGLIERFIKEAGGPDARIVYVPCSFQEEISQEPGFVRLLRGRGAKNVTWIHTKDREKSDTDEEFLEPLKDAGGVWFGGGRQWNLVDSYMDTKAHDLMRDVLKRGGVIGGSSAGASIQAEFLARGDPLGNLNIIAPGYLRGLGFLPGAAVDQHFTQRGRQKDMTELMKAYPQVLGIGIDEGTAIIVQGVVAEVVGTGAVHFYDYRVTPTGETDFLRLEKGKTYDLKERRQVVAK
ncbi:MAG: cyanophycinase [Armatimonadetes bacterium]|nr:cyanophycinase [Armatimonadota bacterium]